MDEVEEFLEHFGVKGMRWGQKKTGNKPKKPERSEGAKQMRRARIAAVAIPVAIIAVQAGAHHIGRQAYLRDVASRRVSTFTPDILSNGRSFTTSAIALGPIGSTSLPRLNGAIPL